MNFKIILLDVDDTILDFSAAENFAFNKTHADLKIEYSQDDFLSYKKINTELWRHMEEGRVDMNHVRETRWREYFKLRNLKGDPKQFHLEYENNLSLSAVVFNDGVVDTLQFLKDRARLFTVTNGIKNIQEKRLADSGLDKFFEKYFISEEIGYVKPHKSFFDFVEKNIKGFDKDECLLVGDSASTDMKAKKHGFTCCLIDRDGTTIKRCDPTPDFVISRFDELKNFYI